MQEFVLNFVVISLIAYEFIQCGVFDILKRLSKAVSVLQALNRRIWAGSQRGPYISDESSASIRTT